MLEAAALGEHLNANIKVTLSMDSVQKDEHLCPVELLEHDDHHCGGGGSMTEEDGSPVARLPGENLPNVKY